MQVADTLVVEGNVTATGSIVANGGVNQASVTNNIVAAGTVQGNATALTTTTNIVGNVVAGTGVALALSGAGVNQTVINGNSTTVLVYANAAETGGNTTINGINGNLGVSVYGGSVATFRCAAVAGGNGTWYAAAETGVNSAYIANASAGNFTLSAANITGGASQVVFQNTAGSGNVVATLPTVASALTAMELAAINTGYVLRFLNTSGSAGNWTLGNATGWSIFGNTTVAQNTWRDFQIIVTSAASATASIRDVGTGTYT
jgi:hypothetical protein